MDQTGLVLVTLQGQEHPLSPGRIEPAIEAHVIADKDGMDFYSSVGFLQQVFHLQVLQVSLKANVVVSRLSDFRLAQSLAQHVARVAGAAAGSVVRCTCQASRGIAHGAGQKGCAHDLVVGTGAGVGLLREAAQEAVLIAVEKRLDAREPVGRSSRNKKKSKSK